MMRQAIVDQKLIAENGFRVRGPDVSRIEGFSDAAFAFAVTLLVVSLEVPRNFDQLLDVLRGIPAFAVCFAILIWLWVAHFKFFRRFGLEGRLTIALNSVLLFVVMVYVYPLKFVFTIFLGMLTGIQPRNTGTIRNDQVGDLFIVYGLGFFAVFLILGLMNWHAYALRRRLELNQIEELMTRAEIARCFGVAGIGLFSVLLAIVIPGGAAGLAGIAYALVGAVELFIGLRFGSKRSDLLREAQAQGDDSSGVPPSA